MIIGIIGLGSIGLVHAKNLLAMGHAVTVYDPKMTQTELDINSASDVGMLLWAADAVVIASPSSEHFSQIADCLFKAKPVFVEKPIFGHGGSGSKWDAVCSLIERNNPPIMTGNNMRYHPVVKLAKEHVERLGPPQEAWFRILQKNTKYTDPVVLNWGAHEVDLALYLVDGNLKFDVGDVAQDRAIFALKSTGHSVGVHLDYLAEPWIRDFALHWPDTSIHADVQNFKMDIYKTEEREIVSREAVAVEGSHEQTYVDEMREFIRRVEGHSTDGIGATGEDGLRCLKLLLEAQKS